MRRFLRFAAKSPVRVALAVFLVTAFLSISAFAAKTTVSVTNNTTYALRAVFKAVGCVHFLSGSADGNQTSDGNTIHNQTDEVCEVKYVGPGETVSYEFGGGTSGRKVWAEIYSATPEMLILNGNYDDQMKAAWDSAYVGNSAIVQKNWTWRYDLIDDGTNSCAVQGFGIIHDAHVTWNKIEVQEVCHPAPGPGGVGAACGDLLFKADCGSVVSQPEAQFVSLGECETLVRNRHIGSSLTFLQQIVGGLADDCAANAKSQGQVVSCITQGLGILAQVKVITGAEKGAITACAAQSLPHGKYTEKR